jgi:hypothetical protein
MTDSTNSPAAAARLFTATFSIPSCRFRTDDLVRIYNIINERQIEYGATVVALLYKLPDETPETFEARRQRVSRSFYTTVNVTGANNEVVTGSGVEFLTSVNIPEDIRTVYFSTIHGPGTAGIGEAMLRSKVTLLLDFSKPIDLTGNPSFATANTSSLTIWSWTESWFTAVHTRLMQLFASRRTGFDWLHRPTIYDVLLMVVGLPFAFWINFRLGPLIDRVATAPIINAALYVYCFFVGLYIFRALFGYSRWVFPKLEIAEANSAPLKHRAIWTVVMLAVFSSAIWDAIKALS